ncbi:hypothetical protein [Caballeronia sp. LjRoot31]|uniref:hypothetical protein n=1 Tax=Caballeronia sp. LjRoot31 TaxID=3342324 RepID=UPI003ED0BAEC
MENNNEGHYMDVLTVTQVWDEVKRTGSKISSLSATQAFFTLIQATADAVDARSSGESAGVIQKWMNGDEAIAMVFAYYVWTGFDDRNAAIVGAMLTEYCRTEIIASFYEFYPQLAKKRFEELFPDGVGESPVQLTMDIGQYALTNRTNIKQHWNPFREPFASDWHDAF